MVQLQNTKRLWRRDASLWVSGLLLIGLMMAAHPGPATAQQAGPATMANAPMPGDNSAMAPAGPGKRSNQPHYQFDKTDFIKATMGTVQGKVFKDQPATFCVGEPVVVPVVLSNHTRFPITVSTNFNPRGYLNVRVRPEGDREHRSLGPSLPGSYPPSSFFFYPYEEYSTQVVLWGDSQDPAGLVFPQAGVYTIQMELTIEVPEGSFRGKLPIGPFTITVQDTPAELAPFVDKLKKDKAAVDLTLRKTPVAWQGEIAGLIEKNPPNLFTPYLAYAAADYFSTEAAAHPGDKALADNALKFFQIAALSSSPFKAEAYMDLLSLIDKMELPAQAVKVANDMLQVMPRDRIGRIGELPALKRYLKNTREIDPTHYWALLQ